MADWLLSDYVGGNNAEEACDLHAISMRSACDQLAISMQSACNLHAISMPSEEACDLLATRKRLAGVERRTAPEQLECWVTNGCLADVTPVHAKSLVDAWLERRAKLETPSNIQVVDDLM